MVPKCCRCFSNLQGIGPSLVKRLRTGKKNINMCCLTLSCLALNKNHILRLSSMAFVLLQRRQTIQKHHVHNEYLMCIHLKVFKSLVHGPSESQVWPTRISNPKAFCGVQIISAGLTQEHCLFTASQVNIDRHHPACAALLAVILQTTKMNKNKQTTVSKTTLVGGMCWAFEN